MWSGAWPSLAIQNLDKALADIEILVAHPPSAQVDEVTRALSRFLVVRSCGYLEQVVEECSTAFISSRSAPQVTSFASSWYMGRGSNPWAHKLVALLARFDGVWAAEFEEILSADDHRLKGELNLLVDRRNKIAHGLSEGIGSVKALELLGTARDVADWFILRLDPR